MQWPSTEVGCPPGSDELAMLVLKNHEQLDVQYKGMMPLNRIYVPEFLEEREEQAWIVCRR